MQIHDTHGVVTRETARKPPPNALYSVLDAVVWACAAAELLLRLQVVYRLQICGDKAALPCSARLRRGRMRNLAQDRRFFDALA